MSLVAAFATQSEALIVADRRRTRLTNGEFYDDVTKVYRLSDYVLIGFSGIYTVLEDQTGFLGICERFINLLPPSHYKTIEDAAEMMADLIARSLQAGTDPELLEMTFLFAGMTRQGVYGVARVSHYDDFDVVTQISAAGSFTWGIILPEYNPSEWIEQQRLSTQNVSLDDLQRLARHIAEEGSEKDIFISSEYDILTLIHP